MLNRFDEEPKVSELPNMCALLASLIRMMSCYVKEPSVNYAMSLVHIMKQIESHPELATNPAAEVAIMQAQTIWRDELMRIRQHCAINCNQIKSNDNNIH